MENNETQTGKETRKISTSPVGTDPQGDLRNYDLPGTSNASRPYVCRLHAGWREYFSTGAGQEESKRVAQATGDVCEGGNGRQPNAGSRGERTIRGT